MAARSHEAVESAGGRDDGRTTAPEPPRPRDGDGPGGATGTGNAPGGDPGRPRRGARADLASGVSGPYAGD